MKSSCCDIAVIGAGPAGLSFALALADTGLKICLIERQAASVLANPPLDGRDIALTHDSMRSLGELGILAHIPKPEISPIREARVFNGASSYFLGFDTVNTGEDALGFLVSNHIIRKAAYKAAGNLGNVTIIDNATVESVSTDGSCGTVGLHNGASLTAPLIVAADSRFSASRDRMGITAASADFKRTAIVCRVSHTKNHGQCAEECFFDDLTIAILPLNGKRSSIVVTLPTSAAADFMGMSPAKFIAEVAGHIGDRLGDMELLGERYAYPLIAVYANSFVARRFALLGDAAVGMHPVTAHGYNLGLAGAVRLAQEIRNNLFLGLDIGDRRALTAYERAHRRSSAFLYHGTNALVKIYTDSRPHMRLMRNLGLRLGNRLPPFKRYVTRQLTGSGCLA